MAYRNNSDYIGKKYNNLTVVSLAERKKLKSGRNICMVNCKCDCGNISVYKLYDLKISHSKSCGCKKTVFIKRHGLASNEIYPLWKGMNARCRNTKNKDYNGRGITVCEEWKNTPNKFIEWALKNGYNKTLQLDRKNNNGNYSPSNCRFVTRSINLRNTRVNRVLTYRGESKTMTDWAEILKVSFDRLRWHINIGGTVDYALRRIKYIDHRQKK